MDAAIPLTLRDVGLLALFVIVRDGIPFLMRSVFPAWTKNKQTQLDIEAKIKEHELELKREIAERDKQFDERQTRAIEAIQISIKDLTVLIASNNVEVSKLSVEAREYFTEGRQAMKQVAVMSDRQLKNKKR